MYGDLVLAVNWFMDLSALWATAWILRLRVRPARVAAAAGLGAVYAMAVLFWPALGGWWIRTAMSIVMIRLSMPLRGWSVLVQGAACFHMANFVFAGAVIAVQTGIGGAVAADTGVVVFQQTPVWLWRLRSGTVMAAVPLGLLLLWGFYRIKRKNDLLWDHVCRVEIATRFGCCSIPGLIDSGNQLTEPLSGWPVVIVEADAVRPAFSDELMSWLNQLGKSSEPHLSHRAAGSPPEDWAVRLRMIPWRGVEGRAGWMVAVRPDWVRVHYGGAARTSRRVYVAFQREALDTRRRYMAVVPAAVLRVEEPAAKHAAD